MTKQFILTICFLSIINSIDALSQSTITIDPTQGKHQVSPMVQGHGMIYSHDADAIFADGSIGQLFQDIHTSFLRWPGGTVTTHYHWNDLNGLGWSDNWDPNYDNSKDPLPSEFMDLDEYISLCQTYNIEPMLGINLSSGMEWDRQAEGVQEAVDLINYCKTKNFQVKYFYLDNETYHSGNLHNKDPNGDGKKWTAASYASEFNTYAEAIKELVPDAILIANWSNQIRNNNALKTLIANAGDNIDYIDIHWYWQRDAATWDLWKSQTPMQFDNKWYDGGTFIEEIDYFRNLTSELGKPHIDIASLEWNIAPGPWQQDINHTKFKTALLQSEMMMQFILGGLEVSSLWSTHWPNTDDASDRFLVDPDGGYTPNPSSKIFELYKESLGHTLIEAQISNNNSLVCAVRKNESQIIVYALSKANNDLNTTISLNNYEITSVEQSVRFTDPGIIENIAMWQSGNDWKVNLKQNTLTMMVLNIEDQATQIANNIKNDSNQNQIQYNRELNSITIPMTGFIGESHISVFNLSGQCIFIESVNASANVVTINTSELPKGTYVIGVHDAFGKRHSSKVSIF